MLRRRYLTLLVYILFLGMVFSSAATTSFESKQTGDPVVVYQLSGQITGVTTLAIQDLLTTANDASARLIIIELSTTGGELGAVGQIMQLFTTSPIPVLVYVPSASQAISGGTYLLTASSIAAMGPAARIGSCHPIWGIFPFTDPNYLDSLVALMSSHAHLHERNETTATQFILENLNLGPVEAQNLGSIELVANSLDELLVTLESYTLVQRELQRDDFSYRIFLSADLGSINYTQIIQDLDGVSAANRITYSPSFSLNILSFLAHPVISFILLQVGIWGFIFALNAPGHLGEIVSAICILLALVGLGIIGISVAGMVMMIVGLVLIIVEAKTDIGFAGLAGMIGVACFVFGGIFYLPPNQWLIPSQLMWAFQGSSAVVALVFAGLFGYAIYKAAQARGLPSDFDPKEMPGTIGLAITNLDPEGQIRAFGENWTAIAEEGVIKAGESVEVVKLDGIRLIVKRSDVPYEIEPETST
ncbi:MAG: nodulation protein NfeD [Candidatus Hermodarchaeota archaeon]|nr:nodulation protein NfeD [Candidatus Hermodarchaeota archaeon]